MPETDDELALRLIEFADYGVPIAIGIISELGVADYLADGPHTVEYIAGATRTHPRSLYRLMRSVVSSGLFVETEPCSFELGPMGRLLLSTNSIGLRDTFLVLAADLEAWARLDEGLLSGEPTFERVHGESLWQFLARHPADSARFDRTMRAMTRLELLGIADAYDWGKLGSIVDVGGGSGVFLAGLLMRYPGLRGILVDLKNVVAEAALLLDDAGLQTRCSIVTSDFFRWVPAGEDAYILKRVLYSWSDERAMAILRVVREAMRSDSRLLVVEPVRRHSPGFDIGVILDLQMLLLGEGHVRDRSELRALFSQARLKLSRLIPTPIVSIVEARPQ